MSEKEITLDDMIKWVKKDPVKGTLPLWQKYVSQHPDQWYQWKKWNAMKAVS